jgi:hypothetical protein
VPHNRPSTTGGGGRPAHPLSQPLSQPLLTSTARRQPDLQSRLPGASVVQPACPWEGPQRVSSRPQAGRVRSATGEASPRSACPALISQHLPISGVPMQAHTVARGPSPHSNQPSNYPTEQPPTATGAASVQAAAPARTTPRTAVRHHRAVGLYFRSRRVRGTPGYSRRIMD